MKTKRRSREGTTTIGANLPNPIGLAFNLLVAKIAVRRNKPVTNQSLLAEVWVDYFNKYGEKVPPELCEATIPLPRGARARAARTAEN